MGGGGFWSEDHRNKAQRAGGIASIDRVRQTHFDKLKSDVKYREEWLVSQTISHSGERNGFYGKTHSSDFKDRMSRIMSEYSGVKNSQYGTIWIIKDGIARKIKKENLNEYLSEGWVRGRK